MLMLGDGGGGGGGGSRYDRVFIEGTPSLWDPRPAG